ncbi:MULTISPECIES: hypothetical protein [Streptomyces]|uniref:8-oxoguanine DNA glycosylase OGG fold protein n=1 Tax=Streptomyces TaxID=1883 RepID=UPI0007CD6620|nr:hypothetical protein A4V12_20810 [Streptomyces noursei]
MGRQDLADALDAEMMRLLLPEAAVRALGAWSAGPGARYASGSGDHAVAYVPVHWSGVEPWPDGFAARTDGRIATVDRAQARTAVQRAAARGEWEKALVASYVWGQGRTGYGPHRLAEILAGPGVADAVAHADRHLGEAGAVAAYQALRGTVKGLGPAFFTKLLYFLDRRPHTPGGAPRALILDQRVARVLRVHAARVGRESGVPDAADVAAWIWSDTGWTSHRYAVYLRFMTAAADRAARAGTGRPWSRPDLLELALFEGAWDPAA